jgi:hypothetical protein
MHDTRIAQRYQRALGQGSVFLWLIVLCTLAVGACGESGGEGFEISLVATGEVVLSDHHISAFEPHLQKLILSAEGVERWSSYIPRNSSGSPGIGGLTGKEFVLSIDGVEMYRGHFSSWASSFLPSGVLIFDAMMPDTGELWITMAELGRQSTKDPRGRPEIADYFRRQGKLKDTSHPPSN